MYVVYVFPRAPSEEERERRESISSISPTATPRLRKDSTVSTTSSNRVKVRKFKRNLLHGFIIEVDHELYDGSNYRSSRLS